MKKTITLLVTLLLAFSGFTQNGINYKAVIKDAAGNIMESAPVSIQFIIYEGVALTNNVYQESHILNTDANGIIIVNIGEGTTADDFSSIAWENDDHFLNVQVNIGAGLVDLGTTQFKTVPYALVAKDVENAIWDTNGTSTFYNEGNVGIGSNSPLAKLDIVGSGTGSTAARVTSPTGTSSLQLFHPDPARIDWSINSGVTTDELQIGSSDNNFATGSVRLRLKPNGDIIMAENEGRVGIGDFSPVNPFSVLQSSGNENTVRIESLVHPSGKDLIELVIPSGSTAGSQFIEMQNGNTIVAAVNGDGSAIFKSVQFEDFSVQTTAAVGPLAYGLVQSSSTVSSGSGNFSVVWNATYDRYEITIAGENYFWTNYTTNVTSASSSVYRLRTSSSGGKLVVYLYNSTGTLIQGNFQFTTYK
ncbi:hypothetical protein [Lacinutrix chionoecetis]